MKSRSQQIPESITIRNMKRNEAINKASKGNREKGHLLALSAPASLPTTMEIMGLVISSLVKEAKYCTCLQITDLRHVSLLETQSAAEINNSIQKAPPVLFKSSFIKAGEFESKNSMLHPFSLYRYVTGNVNQYIYWILAQHIVERNINLQNWHMG